MARLESLHKHRVRSLMMAGLIVSLRSSKLTFASLHNNNQAPLAAYVQAWCKRSAFLRQPHTLSDCVQAYSSFSSADVQGVRVALQHHWHLSEQHLSRLRRRAWMCLKARHSCLARCKHRAGVLALTQVSPGQQRQERSCNTSGRLHFKHTISSLAIRGLHHPRLSSK